MISDFTLYQWSYFLIPNNVNNKQEDFDEFLQELNLLAKELYAWIELDDNLTIIAEELNSSSVIKFASSDWVENANSAKSFTLGRYLDGVFLLTATAYLGEYQEQSMPLFSLSKDLKNSRFYLDTKMVKVAEIDKNQTSLVAKAKSILKKDEITEVEFDFGYLYNELFFIHKNRIEEFATLLHNDIKSIYFSLSKLTYINQKMLSSEREFEHFEKQIAKVTTDEFNIELKNKSLSELESISTNTASFQNSLDRRLSEYEENIHTLEIARKNILLALNQLPKEKLENYYLLDLNFKIEQYKSNLKYFMLTKSTIDNIQSSLEIVTNIKSTKEDRRLSYSVGVLTLVAIVQVFPELSRPDRVTSVVFIGIVALILFFREKR